MGEEKCSERGLFLPKLRIYFKGPRTFALSGGYKIELRNLELRSRSQRTRNAHFNGLYLEQALPV